VEINLDPLTEKETYALLTQTIIPRPIAWVLTENSTGGSDSWNLAPFSFFNGIASSPPMVMFSIGSWDESGHLKDTLVNVRKNKSFTIGIANQHQVTKVQQTAAELPLGVSEVNEYEISVTKWDWPTPLIDGCRINFGCSLAKEIQIEQSSQVVIFARIVKLWVDDQAISRDDRNRIVINPEKIDPLLRLGAGKYGNLGSVIMAPDVTK
jgi:flavin reductase (DIM6/NTAB) family NADH-FMN oxidoreductase RutF